MLEHVLALFHMKPDYDLDIMRPDQSLSCLTANLFLHLDRVMQQAKPDWILAQGDTTTVLVASLTAFYNKIPFGHVEAGLRTRDFDQPFPEEMNRRVADSTARLLFAPTENSRLNLLHEGCKSDRIIITGNTVVDALSSIINLPYDWQSSPFRNIPSEKKIVLVTAHRRETFGPKLREICSAVLELAIEFENQGFHFVYPVHMNPNVRGTVMEILSGTPNITLTDPLDYQSLVQLMKKSFLILTDSGGIQEEAPSLGVPVLVMRETTERPEGLEAGVLKVVGSQKPRILKETRQLLTDQSARDSMVKGTNPFGDGKAAKRIVSALLEHSHR